MITAAEDYPLADLAWTMALFFTLMICFWLVLTALGDLFRRRDLSGWAKAGWCAAVVVLPLVASLAYLVTRGRALPRPGAPVDEIARAKGLLDDGAITPAEFEQLKTRLLA